MLFHLDASLYELSAKQELQCFAGDRRQGVQS